MLLGDEFLCSANGSSATRTQTATINPFSSKLSSSRMGEIIDGKQKYQQIRQQKGVLGFDLFELKSTPRDRGEISESDVDNNSLIHASNLKKNFFDVNRMDHQSVVSTDVDTVTLIPDVNNDVKLVHYSTSSTVLPAWFPWIPTKDQIMTLKLKVLKEACSQRGLIKSGNKDVVQERLLKWTNECHLTQQKNQFKTKSDNCDSLTIPILTSSILRRRRQQKEEIHVISNEVNIVGSIPDSNIMAFEEIVTNDKPVFNSDTPNSLAEWTRSVDSAKLTRKRQEIHRQKRLGKKPPPTDIKKRKAGTAAATKEYILKLKNAMKTSPSSPYASNKEVKELYDASKKADQLGEPVLAIQLLESLLEVTPNDARIYRRLSRMYREQGDLNLARSTLQNGLRKLPKNPWLWHGLGQFELSSGENINFGIKCFKRAIKEDITFAHSYHAWGVYEFSNGQIAKSMKILKKGIEYCPTNHRLHHALGDIYRGAKLLQDAERSYRRALEESPRVSSSFAFAALACVAYERDDTDEARNWLYRSIESNDGRHAQGWLALAQIEEAEGNYEKALKVCEASIIQYENGLIEKRRRYKNRPSSRRSRSFGEKRQRNEYECLDINESPQDPITSGIINQGMIKSVPKYRSGDKFLGVYRHWARLEGRYGSSSNTNQIYERASTAFPYDYKVSLDWARFHSKHHNIGEARSLYTEACNRVASRYNNHINNADSYREYASFEMNLGEYERARNILSLGAQKISQSSDNGRSGKNMVQLYVTWAVCEWHLQNIQRSEVLFDHALQLTRNGDGDEGSALRSFILYCMARLEYYERRDIYLAQHCIGLCLKESTLPGDDNNAPVWNLWAKIAREMNNSYLERKCLKEASKCLITNTIDEVGDKDQGSSSAVETMNILRGSQKMKNWMRQEPWHDKLQSIRRTSSHGKGSIDELSEFYGTIQLPNYSSEKLNEEITIPWTTENLQDI